MKDGVGGSLVRKRIEPVVTSTGALFLRSVYRDRDWIYHDHVVVQIGDHELRTEPVASTSPQMSRRTVPRTGSSLGRGRSRANERDDFIAETVSYRGDDESAIVEAIAAAGSAPVVDAAGGGAAPLREAALQRREATVRRGRGTGAAAPGAPR